MHVVATYVLLNLPGVIMIVLALIIHHYGRQHDHPKQP
jgi:hypothetical protein